MNSIVRHANCRSGSAHCGWLFVCTAVQAAKARTGFLETQQVRQRVPLELQIGSETAEEAALWRQGWHLRGREIDVVSWGMSEALEVVRERLA